MQLVNNRNWKLDKNDDLIEGTIIDAKTLTFVLLYKQNGAR